MIILRLTQSHLILLPLIQLHLTQLLLTQLLLIRLLLIRPQPTQHRPTLLLHTLNHLTMFPRTIATLPVREREAKEVKDTKEEEAKVKA